MSEKNKSDIYSAWWRCLLISIEVRHTVPIICLKYSLQYTPMKPEREQPFTLKRSYHLSGVLKYVNYALWSGINYHPFYCVTLRGPVMELPNVSIIYKWSYRIVSTQYIYHEMNTRAPLSWGTRGTFTLVVLRLLTQNIGKISTFEAILSNHLRYYHE